MYILRNRMQYLGIPKVLLSVVLLGILIVSIPSQSGSNQIGNRGASIPISPNTNSDWTWRSSFVISNESTTTSASPKAVSDSRDNLHVVWNDNTNFNDHFFASLTVKLNAA